MRQESFNLLHERMIGLELDHHPQYKNYWQKTVAGRYFNGTHSMGTSTAQALAKDAVIFFPIYFGTTSTVDALALSVNTASPGSTIRLSAYLDDGTYNSPGLLLANLGTISGATTGVKQVVFGSVVFGPGTFFWMGVSCNDTNLLFDCVDSTGWAPYGCASPATPVYATNVSDLSAVFSGSWESNASNYTLAYDSTVYPMLFLRGA